MIYADNAATTKMSQTAIDAMVPCMQEVWGNPSSLYAFGQKAAEALLAAREKVAACIGADVKEIFLNPKSETSKRLVLSSDHKTELTTNKKCIRIVFDGISSYEPVLADLVLETQVRLNIMGANTEDIGGSAYGQMLIERPDEKSVEIIKNHLNKKGVRFEEFELKEEKEEA